MRKLALEMAVNSCTPVGFYLSCMVSEMLEYAELLKEMQKKITPSEGGERSGQRCADC